MYKLAFIDIEGVVKFIATEMTAPVKEMIIRSLLKPVFVDDSVKVGDKYCDPLSSLKLDSEKYDVGDVVFHPYHQKNFLVYKLETRVSPNGTEYTMPHLVEKDPANPKMPVLVSFTYECTYPKVSV